MNNKRRPAPLRPVIWGLYFVDILVILLFLFNTGAHFLTNLSVRLVVTPEEHNAHTIERAGQVMNLVEQNPLMKILLQTSGVQWIYQFLVLPAFIFGMYWWMRRKYGVQRGSPLEFYIILIVVVCAMDFLNDLNIVLAQLIAMGVHP
jgi:hypothetical protein